MAKKPSNKPTKKNKSAEQSSIEVGDINVGGSVYGHIIIGHGNIINMSPEQQAFLSLHQLPQPPADFAGREELITQFLADFEKGKGAAITGQPIHGLVGMGGIGKTALGLVVAHQLKKDYPDAQIFLDLKGTTAPLSAIDIMRHVILSFEPTTDVRTLDDSSMSAKYQSVLHDKRALLFLDNARSAAQIAPLRPPETCALLVTSRWTFGVPGLKHRHVGVMSQENAQKFLLELCPRIGTKTNEFAKACAYLPLALRIAGSFLQINEDWKVEKYLAQLNDRQRRLTTLEQSHEEAELTIEPNILVTFELSYHQLSEADQQRWRMLGVFPASFDVGAIIAIWKLKENATRNLIGLLVRYSLLDYDEISSRYSLHDLLSDYALSQMKDEEEKEARLKHATHYKDVLSAADDLYQEGGQKVLTSLRLFDLEWENIRTGQSWASQNTSDGNCLKLCNEYPNAGRAIISFRLHPKEYITWLEKGLNAARKLSNKQYEGYHLGNLGIVYRNLGEVRKAVKLHEQAHAIHSELGDHRGEAQALTNLGNAYFSFGEVRKAIMLHEQALAILGETGDRQVVAHALGNLGIAYKNLGEVRKAIMLHEQALAFLHELGDHHGEAQALGNLGNAYFSLGEVRKAIAFYEQALAILSEIGDRLGQGNALFNIGLALYRLKEKYRAIDLMKRALEIYEDREAPGAEQARKKLKEWGAL